MQLFDSYIGSFLNLKDEPYYDRGILPSEAFAFMTYCKVNKIDLIIESGTAFGQSCYLFAKYLQIPVHTIDNTINYGDAASQVAAERCKDLPVIFHKGDSNYLLPKLVEEFSKEKKRIAVFIDGPKGIHAQILRDRVWINSQVFVAGVHDSEGKNIEGKFSSSTNPTFLSRFRNLLDEKSLLHPYPDNPARTLKERFPTGMGIDIWFKPRDIIYFVFTGGENTLYKDFRENLKSKFPRYFTYCLTDDRSVEADHIENFLEVERGGVVGPKMTALRRLPFQEGDRVFVTDIDVYLNQDIFQIFNFENLVLGVTSRNKKQGPAAIYSPINGGVWCFRFTKQIEILFEWIYNQIISPSDKDWLKYKESHPYNTKIGIKEWWVDQDILNFVYAHKNEFTPGIVDIGPEYNWIVSDEEFQEFKDKQYKVLHRKSGTQSRWQKD